MPRKLPLPNDIPRTIRAKSPQSGISIKIPEVRSQTRACSPSIDGGVRWPRQGTIQYLTRPHRSPPSWVQPIVAMLHKYLRNLDLKSISSGDMIKGTRIKKRKTTRRFRTVDHQGPLRSGRGTFCAEPTTRSVCVCEGAIDPVTGVPLPAGVKEERKNPRMVRSTTLLSFNKSQSLNNVWNRVRVSGAPPGRIGSDRRPPDSRGGGELRTVVSLGHDRI